MKGKNKNKMEQMKNSARGGGRGGKRVLALPCFLPRGGREGKGRMRRIQWTFLEVCRRETDHGLSLVLCYRAVPIQGIALWA